MKVTFPTGKGTRNIKIPNALIVNRVSFGIIKFFLAIQHPKFWKIKYKQIKPFLKKIKHYKNYEIVSIKTRQGENIRISL